MTRTFKVKEDVQQARTFQSTTNGMPTEVKAVGVMLSDGRNTLYAEAYRERADAVEQLRLMKGDLVLVQLSVIARRKTKDGVTYYSNCVSIDALQLLLRKRDQE